MPCGYFCDMADSEDRWGGGGRSLMAVSVAIVTDGLWKFHDGFWTKVFSLSLAMCVCAECGRVFVLLKQLAEKKTAAVDVWFKHCVKLSQIERSDFAYSALMFELITNIPAIISNFWAWFAASYATLQVAWDGEAGFDLRCLCPCVLGFTW